MTDYALVTLAELRRSGAPRSSTSVAAATGIPAAATSRVLKTLHASGFVSSTRGRLGGYLASPLPALTVLDVVEAIEGRVEICPCTDEGGCAVAPSCPSRGRWSELNEGVRAALAAMTVDRFARPDLPAPGRCKEACRCS
jgi:Rrf2 family protein